jgi:hypothetical protein
MIDNRCDRGEPLVEIADPVQYSRSRNGTARIGNFIVKGRMRLGHPITLRSPRIIGRSAGWAQ